MDEVLFGKWKIESWQSKFITHEPDQSPFELNKEDIIQEASIYVWNEEKFTSGIYDKGLLRLVKSESEFPNYCFEFSSNTFYNAYELNIWNLKDQKIIKKASWEQDSTDGVSFSLWDYPIFSKLIELSPSNLLIREIHEMEECHTYVHDICFKKIKENPDIREEQNYHKDLNENENSRAQDKTDKEINVNKKPKRSFWKNWLK